VWHDARRHTHTHTSPGSDCRQKCSVVPWSYPGSYLPRVLACSEAVKRRTYAPDCEVRHLVGGCWFCMQGMAGLTTRGGNSDGGYVAASAHYCAAWYFDSLTLGPPVCMHDQRMTRHVRDLGGVVVLRFGWALFVCSPYQQGRCEEGSCSCGWWPFVRRSAVWCWDTRGGPNLPCSTHRHWTWIQVASCMWQGYGAP
jgi:hypothetical protein